MKTEMYQMMRTRLQARNTRLCSVPGINPSRRARRRAAIAAAAAAVALGGCGGGSGTEVHGQVLSADGDEAWTVCVDLNRNFRCDVDETTRARLDATGAYALMLPRSARPDDTLLVAESGEGDKRSWLAAPASAASIGIFSTLAAVQWQATPDEGPDTAQQPLRALFGLSERVDLFDAENWADDVSLRANARALREAWEAAHAALASAGSGESQALAAALMSTTARYLDPERHRLLPGVTARTLGGEAVQSVRPSACTSAAPVTMHIDTDQAAPIVTKSDYVKGWLRIDTPEATEPTALRLSIRGRGNATWALPKKPYRIKLDQPASLLGLAPERNWALLANYLDKTMLRNALAFCMGSQLGLDYTPASRFVELRLNGRYQGVYELAEQIRVGPHRVDIGETAPTEDDPGGFLVEIDARLDEDYWFYSGSPLHMPYTVKSDTDAAQTARIKAVIDDFERRLFGPDFIDPEDGYASSVDVEALIDYYLINEWVRNNDVFFSSTFVHRKDRGKLVFGPLWDFDIAAGNINPAGHETPEGWWARDKAYLPRLFEDPAFARQVAARWQFLSSRMPALLDFVRDSAAALDAAQARNFSVWNIGEEPGWPQNRLLRGSYAGEVEYLETWLQQRAAWLDRQFGS